MTLGLSMIVKNESDVLSRALSSVAKFADEIVIVDTGSADGTKDIARSFTDKVYDFEWIDDFSAARNFALKHVTTDYWMWLDADDIVPYKTALQIKKFMAACDGSADVIMLPYVLGYNENNKPAFSFYRERILKNRPDLFWQGRVHEAVTPIGKVSRLPYPIVHAKPQNKSSGARNLDIYRKMRIENITFSPRERYYYARELFYNGFTTDAAEEFKAYLNMPGGFSANKIDACVMLAKCFIASGEVDSALAAAFNSFMFGLPTGEACCEIGGIFFGKGDYASAAYWYERALRAKPDTASGAFVNSEYYGFTPLVWLSVCYDRLGETKKAFRYHLRAKKLRPDNQSIIHNSAYFSGLGFNDPR